MQQTSVMNPPSRVPGTGAAPPLIPAATRYLARQPILDLRGRVVAYELLFRSGAASAFSGSGEVATQTMIDNTMICGLGKLTAGLPAFINCTAETLSGDHIQMLPPSLTVIEVLEDVEPSEAVVKACVGLRRKGYKIALDDFEYRPSLDPLIRIADYIKIDFLATPASRRRRLIAELREFKGTYLAEKVESREDHEEALREGFKLFQGYYFCKPALLKTNAVPSNHHVHLRLLKLLQANPLDIAAISELVKSEPSLAYRLLRYVNSAARGMRQEITSIKTALLVAGDNLFRRMATLAVAVELNSGCSDEILRMALLRARFCETTSSLCNLNSTEQYLLGLFSLLDAMLQVNMEEALAPLSLSAPIRAALLGADSGFRYPLNWLESHERGDFTRCDQLAASLGFTPGLLVENFHQAALWADELLTEN